MTALKAAEPQSHEAQARILPLVEAVVPAASSEAGRGVSGTAVVSMV
jgi:hypothetical protein